MKREDVHLGIYLSHFFSFHVHFILRKDFSWKERGHKEEGGKGKHCSLERVSRLTTIPSLLSEFRIVRKGDPLLPLSL